MKRDKILIVSFILLAGICVFLILIKEDPTYVSNIPVIGGIIFHGSVPGSTTNGGSGGNSSGNASNNSSSQSLSSSLSTGASVDNNQVKPVTGTKLSPAGAYTDGTYIGFSTDSSGILMLEVTIKGGALTTINTIDTPSDFSSSDVQILIQSAIHSQAVEISPTNGYDKEDTIFTQAMENALQKAFKVTH